MLKVTNATRATDVALSAKLYDTFFNRFRGLMLTAGLARGNAVIITPCHQIHMFWMRFPLDAIFVDAQNVVVGLAPNIKPWAVSSIFNRARSVIEVPVGTIAETATEIGDQILIQ